MTENNLIRSRRRRVSASIAVGATVIASLSVLAIGATPIASASAATAATATAGEITQTMTYNGKTVTVRLQPFQLRGPGFEVLVQQPDGSLAKQTVRGERSYMGTVDGDSAARVSAIRRSDGVLAGKIVFDRGQTQWWFQNGAVTQTDINGNPDFKWPSFEEAARNVSTSPGQAGSTVNRFDVGYDLTSAWVNDASIGGSVDKALDVLEEELLQMAGVYINNAMLRPALGRVILRADPAHDPYFNGGGLSATETEWTTNQSDANVDVIIQHREPDGSGGVAYYGTATTSGGIARVSGRGVRGATRHEVGHNWNVDDNHTYGPEGATIMSGNTFERFDGTELSAIFSYRDRTSVKAKLVPMGAFDQPMAPYAALDLVDGATSGVAKQASPIANDHDANGDALSLVSVEPTTKLGGAVTIGAGNTISYTPPRVTADDTVDSVTYVVQDATGRTATGVALFKVDPPADPGPATSWPIASWVQTGTAYGFVNKVSGLSASTRSEDVASPDVLQRAGSGTDATLFTVVNAGGVEGMPYYRLKNIATGKCVDVGAGVTAGTVVTQSTCTDLKSMKWRIVNHPRGGEALLNLKTGLCLAPQNGSLAADAVLTQVACSIDQASSWLPKAPPVAKWKLAASPDSTKNYVLQVRGTNAGAMVDSSEWVQLNTTGGGTPLSFTKNVNGTWMIKNPANSSRCLVNYHNESVDVAQRGCGTADGQSWRLLQHPFGGVAIQTALSSGKCLQTEAGRTSAGTWVVFGDCSEAPTQRWNLVAAPAA